ncbi:kinase-like domain-containing protein [Mycena albidolilacea]|uniref:Kinase-like domain-containing protein n=1 Tax=Mycena albidolilacea TaxID=1033008 RepID=A0AAD6ZXG1_9AGAR|nr:kinase-like domain-containing protein [Mycena albidolilacea]
MSHSSPERYKEHILRHEFQILDHRVTLMDRRAVSIGKLNCSDVYMGSLQSLQAGSPPERVAVKMIRGQSLTDSEIKKFLKELHTWSKLRNEHILPLRGVTVELYGTLSIISPWMANGSARKYVINGSVDPGPLLDDVARGLHYLHTEIPVFHGDLKGENIIISHDGRALLADFGYSVLVWSSFSLSISEPTGGTPLWTAPEKITDYTDSTASDVYSFGMLALELFTRQDPFYPELLGPEDIVNGKRPRRPTPKVTLERLTDDWWKICELCWVDADKRPTMRHIMEFRAGHVS